MEEKMRQGTMITADQIGMSSQFKNIIGMDQN